jgi:tetratricopeptide (TPR) repeat protein
MLADNASDGDADFARRASRRLADLSLVHVFDDGDAWVHRWTAQGLAALVPEAEHRARHVRAGRYRLSRAIDGSLGLADAWEAVRNFIAGADLDAATALASSMFAQLENAHASGAIAVLAAEVLDAIDENHPRFAVVADAEAQALLALGDTDAALVTAKRIHTRFEGLAAAEPTRADLQRDLSVSFNKLGDLHLALGLADAARDFFQRALGIAERLAAAEPARADLQRDLIVSLVRLGQVDTNGGPAHLLRAWRVLTELKSSGRLAPVDEPMLPDLERMLRERGVEPG